MPGFPGCVSSASGSGRACISGRSTAGTFRPGIRSSPRSIRLCCRAGYANEGRTGDQHDAFSIAAWLSGADCDGSLAAFLDPDLSPPERALAQVEGWILGVADSNNRPMVASTRHQTASTVGLRPMLITAGSGITKACPECGHLFRGGTWAGIDAHWNARHSQIMPYDEAWPMIKAGRKPSDQDGNRPRSRQSGSRRGIAPR